MFSINMVFNFREGTPDTQEFSTICTKLLPTLEVTGYQASQSEGLVKERIEFRLGEHHGFFESAELVDRTILPAPVFRVLNLLYPDYRFLICLVTEGDKPAAVANSLVYRTLKSTLVSNPVCVREVVALFAAKVANISKG